MKPINVISNPTTASIVESSFFQNILLPGYPIGFEWEFERAKNETAVYIEVCELSIDRLKQLRDNGCSIMLIQLGDELFTNYNNEAYELCDIVLRNYFSKQIFDQATTAHKTFWVPNGYAIGVGPRKHELLRPANTRLFLSSFLGWLDNPISYNNERQEFQKVVDNNENVYLYPTAKFAAGYKPGLYASLLEYSIFALCPAGNSPETIRLYDALEVGCIPISLKHDFITDPRCLNNPPFILLDSWSELPSLLLVLRKIHTENREEIIRMQNDCIRWWQMYKQSLAARTTEQLFSISK